MLRNRVLGLMAGLVLAGLIAACGGGRSDDAAPPAETVRRGGTLITALDAAPVGDRFDSLKASDVYTSAVVHAVIEGLVKYNDKLEPVPWLAERYEVSADGLTYTFHLRKGVKFHDGTEMDAEAVKFSVDRVRDERNKQWPGFEDGALVSETAVLDKHTFRLTLKEASAPFVSRLTGRLGGIVSPSAVRSMGDEAFGRAPVGTGPFKFKEYRADNYVRVERFDAYWRNGADGKPLPYLDAIEWRVITEPASRLTALQAGDLHVVSTPASSVRDQDTKLLKADSNLVYGQQAGLTVSGFSFNLSTPPFNNKALRQAVQLAIDRDEIVRVVYEGNREAGYSPLPTPFQWAIDPAYKPYSFDLARARQKLAEGGRPDGFEFTAWIASGSSANQLLFELIQAQLAKAGIRMKIEAADFNGVVVPKARAGDADGHAYGISYLTNTDPDQLLSNRFSKGGNFNYAKYENAKFEELVIAARKTSDKEQRARSYREAVKLLMDDSPYTVLTYGIDRHVGHRKVKGWSMGSQATTSYSEYWLAE
jgi:peptide/nickel transport system substrate-binding protein